MRVAVHHPDPRRGTELELREQLGRPVAFLLVCVRGHPAQCAAVRPLGDQHLGGGGQHRRDTNLRITGERGREHTLGVGLVPVVELGDGGVVQLVDHALDIGAGAQWPDQWRQTTKLPQIGPQGLVGARVLDLDGHLATVGPDGAVDLADRGGCGGITVELREPVPPPQAQLGVQNVLDLVRG